MLSVLCASAFCIGYIGTGSETGIAIHLTILAAYRLIVKWAEAVFISVIINLTTETANGQEKQ